MVDFARAPIPPVDLDQTQTELEPRPQTHSFPDNLLALKHPQFHAKNVIRAKSYIVAPLLASMGMQCRAGNISRSGFQSLAIGIAITAVLKCGRSRMHRWRSGNAPGTGLSGYRANLLRQRTFPYGILNASRSRWNSPVPLTGRGLGQNPCGRGFFPNLLCGLAILRAATQRSRFKSSRLAKSLENRFCVFRSPDGTGR